MTLKDFASKLFVDVEKGRRLFITTSYDDLKVLCPPWKVVSQNTILNYYVFTLERESNFPLDK